MTETLLIVHILAAAAWIGGGLLNGYVTPKMAAAGPEMAAVWLRTLLRATATYFIPAGTLTLLSGIALVLLDDAYDWSAPFVWIGIVVVVVALGMVSVTLRPAVRSAIAAAESGDRPTMAVQGRKSGLAARIIVILLILTEIAMVLRLGV